MSNLMKVAGIPDRFGKGGMVPDRKELRRLDQAAGLIPFACKLHSELITRLHAEVAKNGTTMNVLVESLLNFGRMEAGARKYNLETVNIAELARATAKTFDSVGYILRH